MPILTNTNQIIFPLLYTFASININMGKRRCIKMATVKHKSIDKIHVTEIYKVADFERPTLLHRGDNSQRKSAQ